jgi:hypothetical protein
MVLSPSHNQHEIAKLFMNMELLMVHSMPQHLPRALPVSEGIFMLTDTKKNV